MMHLFHTKPKRHYAPITQWWFSEAFMYLRIQELNNV